MSTRRSQKKNDTNWIHAFQVVQPTRHKKDFTVYKVISKVFPKGHPEGVTTITVWKRYNDFKKLFKDLHLIHRQLHLFGAFPTFPKGTLFGRFESDIIEERRQAALALLQFAALHPHLYTSKVFSKFFEVGYSEDELIIPASGSNPTPNLEEDYLAKPCLVPQKLWAPEDEQGHEDDDDRTSTSSVDSSLLEAACLSPNTECPQLQISEATPDSDPPNQSSKADCDAVPSELQQSLSRSPDIPIPAISVSHSWENISYSDPHYDLHAESGISSSASCSSLETQVPAMPSEEGETDLTDKKPEAHKKLVKKISSFGLFDFLPIFPKKAKEKHLSDEKLLSDSLTASYICEAAGHFAVAQQFESCGEFPRAFSSYKAGIKVLLTGVQDDDNPKRKRLVRSKLEKYIARAESLHGKSPTMLRNVSEDPSQRNYGSMPISSPIKTKIVSASQNATSSHLEEMKDYKVIKVVHKRVYIVVNVKAQANPKCSVIKVLPKSLNMAGAADSPLMSKKLPFLISLQKWFETEYSYILLLEYASGGRLRDFANTYQTKQIVIPKYDPDAEENQEESKAQLQDSDIQKAASCIAVLNELGSRNASPRTDNKLDEGNRHSKSSEESDHILGINDTSEEARSEVEDSNSEIGEAQQERDRVQTLLRMNSLSLDNLKNIDIRDLIENSKFLLQTVDKTLAEADMGGEKLKEAESRLNEGRINRRQPVPSTKLQAKVGAGTDESSSAPGFEEENNNKFRPPFERTNSRFTIFVDLQENTENEFQSVQTGSPTKIRESSSAIDLTQVGVLGLPDSPETEILNIKRMVPECCIKVWAAEIIMALENLHGLGLTYGELDLKNILLGENGHILLSFKSNWFQQDPDYIPDKNDYSAPEVYNSFGQPLCKIHTSADYWSLGAILFELFTGRNARTFHPEGFHEQTILRIPEANLMGESISQNVKSLLAELLQFNPTLRLGYYGAVELKSHPLFEGFDWDGATEAAIMEKSLYT